MLDTQAFFSLLSDPQAWIALATLTGLEIVLGIDNIIFIAILVDKLPLHQRSKARIFGLGLAMFTRIALLLSIFWIMKLTNTIFTLFEHGFSWKDLILIFGGLFLIAKSTLEIHSDIQGPNEEKTIKNATSKGIMSILIQIALLDIVFSLDSIITAVGMVKQVEIMIIAVVLAVGVMMIASKSISNFVSANPTIKILALSFLILVGFTLIVEGFGGHIEKAYIYTAMGFSLAVESINIYIRKKQNTQI